MHIYFTFVSFILGLVLASFLNALLYRIDNGYKYPDIFIKGSHCEKCGKSLTVYELIPVLSFFIFKGKCSKCGYRVPVYYPLSELILGISLASIYYYSLPLIFYILIVFFFAFSYFDRIYKGIPQILVNVFLLFSIGYFFIQVILIDGISENSLIAVIILSGVVLLLGRILKRPFGIGDILVLIGLGFIFPFTFFLSFIYIFLILSSLYSIILVILKKASFKSSIPLLPFMYSSLGILFLFNEKIIDILKGIFLL